MQVDLVTSILLQHKAEKFDDKNDEHAELLRRLWTQLRPNGGEIPRPHRAWGEIGFQGTDPVTDLVFLLFFDTALLLT